MGSKQSKSEKKKEKSVKKSTKTKEQRYVEEEDDNDDIEDEDEMNQKRDVKKREKNRLIPNSRRKKQSPKKRHRRVIKLYHVTHLLATEKKPRWNELILNIANNKENDGLMYRLPVVRTIAIPRRRKLPRSSIYPRDGIEGMKYWRVVFELNIDEYIWFEMYENTNQVHLLAIKNQNRTRKEQLIVKILTLKRRIIPISTDQLLASYFPEQAKASKNHQNPHMKHPHFEKNEDEDDDDDDYDDQFEVHVNFVRNITLKKRKNIKQMDEDELPTTQPHRWDKVKHKKRDIYDLSKQQQRPTVSYLRCVKLWANKTLAVSLDDHEITTFCKKPFSDNVVDDVKLCVEELMNDEPN